MGPKVSQPVYFLIDFFLHNIFISINLELRVAASAADFMTNYNQVTVDG